MSESPLTAEVRSPLAPDPTIRGRSSRHIPALDGVRGVAVIAVILYHASMAASWTTLPGRWAAQVASAGWIGVDLFFVLSGFLITGILLDTRDDRRPLVNFYARRVLRIFPLYYVILAIVFLVLPMLGPVFNTDSLRTIQHRQAYFWTHTTNLGFVIHREMFGAAGWLSLNHLWSLAVEEQFYLVWPWLVIWLGRRWLPTVCVLCIVGSPALRTTLWLLDQRIGALYFPTPCRLDGLAIGSLVATLIRTPFADSLTRVKIQRSVRWLTGVTAIALLALVYWRGGLHFADRPTVAIGILLVNILAAALVFHLSEGSERAPISRMFSLRPLRFFGKFSYSLYLVHAMLIPPMLRAAPPAAFSRLAGGVSDLGSVLFVASVIAISTLVALFTWVAIERPMLSYKSRFHSHVDPRTQSEAA